MDSLADMFGRPDRDANRRRGHANSGASSSSSSPPPTSPTSTTGQHRVAQVLVGAAGAAVGLALLLGGGLAAKKLFDDAERRTSLGSRSTGSLGIKPNILTSSAGGSKLPATPRVRCLRCWGSCYRSEAICAAVNAATSSSTSSAAGCGHFMCRSCLTDYVVGEVKARKLPIHCPMAPAGGVQQPGRGEPGCLHHYSREIVLAALARQPELQLVFGELEAAKAVETSDCIYCPYKDCSVLVECPPLGAMPRDGRTTCPACKRDFCINCRISGWHWGYTCAAFQALPRHLHSAEDAALLTLAEKKRWKQCPGCKLMVARTQGCNYMRCRCGCTFCYACGTRYWFGALFLTCACARQADLHR